MHSFQQVRRFLGLLLFCLLAQQPAFASQLNIGTVFASPRGYIAEDGNQKGASLEIANAIAAQANLSHSNELLPYGRILSHLGSGKTDLAILVLNERVNAVAVPLAHIQDVNFIMVTKPGSDIARPEDLLNLSVGYLGNSVIAANLANDYGAIGIGIDNYSSLIKMLMADRIDAIIGPRINIYWNLMELNYSASDLNEPIPLTKIKMYVVHSKKTLTPSRERVLIESINQLKDEAEITRIIGKYDMSVH
jgi:ABC-type amino acid transport substrate-binding protein